MPTAVEVWLLRISGCIRAGGDVTSRGAVGSLLERQSSGHLIYLEEILCTTVVAVHSICGLPPHRR
ncbi:MAG: hypothetical protein K8J08_13465 [Thermoanaerobaculia bacterium]|nr:hypothetical protein [Thermoanaerobaculia bacterium]